MCPSGNKCCPTPSGSYLCCPYKNGTCCPDGRYCCPHAGCWDGAPGCYATSEAQSVNDFLDNILKPDNVLGYKPQEQTELYKVSSPSETLGIKDVVCPGGKFKCPGQATCCMLPDKHWGCCNFKDASCCSDGIHCCPSGYKCNVHAKKCNLLNEENPRFTKMMKKLKAVSVDVDVDKSVVCQGGKFQCPSGSTCCKSPTGTWGCCPLPNAVCCSDGLHCCPHGNTCDMKQKKCVQQVDTPDVAASVSDTDEINCPDKVSTCPDKTTCCKMKNGYYGCCQYDKAVCCNDFIHCCPSNMHCNTTSGSCYNQFYTLKFGEPESAKKPILRQNGANNVDCPDKKSTCPEKTTCCQTPSGAYGCCPYEKAHCCTDHLHCCPENQQCDVKKGECVDRNTYLRNPWQPKQPSLPIPELYESDSVVCPDKTQCNTGDTCCQSDTQGDYGCCPLPNAVCCSDKKHCCPKNTKCDPAQGKCNAADGTVTDWLEKHNKKEPHVLGNVVCPGKTAQCRDGQTCCKLSSGEWGCCPYPNATCCSDGQSCCPSGYTCDVPHKSCVKGQLSIPWFTKIPAVTHNEVSVGNIVCPGKTAQCRDGQTCCKLSSGEWGCCPYPNATCCSDGQSCCPSGYTCDVPHKSCVKGQQSIPWFTKIPAVTHNQVSVGNIVCPGKTAQCRDGQTCCKLSSGEWGCCPYPNATCCSDGQSCCPSGYTCDVPHKSCVKGQQSIPWFTKIPAVTQNQVSVGNVVCPGKTAQCRDGQACCKLSSGEWGCCPYPNATCCSDGQSCCPSGYTCDVPHKSCVKGHQSIPWFTKIPAVTQNQVSVGNVVCPGKTAQCRDGQTCCKLSSGEWGCCPYPNATCCSDGQSCCPSGYTCDVPHKSCVKGQQSIPWFTKRPAIPHNQEAIGDVICPDKSKCEASTTCCKTMSGQYGCCPLPDAICCSDGLHCCPSNTKCDVKAGRCISTQINSLSTTWYTVKHTLKFRPTETIFKENIGSDKICPGRKVRCPFKQTCCRIAGKQYGCCPLPNAVCCADGKHCCPHGTSCDKATGMCEANTEPGVTLSLGILEPADIVREEVKNVITVPDVSDVECGDHKSHCLDGQTCCKQGTSFGCCPMPGAVCCSDQLHCCAHGTTCDLKSGMCKSNTNSLSATWDLIQKPQLPWLSVRENVLCPDKQSECDAGQTCCKLKTGGYGCCPLQSAVCCSDGLHCCPQGSTCNVQAGTCTSTSNSMTITWDKIKQAVKRTQMPVAMPEPVAIPEPINHDVICPDKKSQCHHDNTCCKLSTGGYGCCPLPAAVCCSDGLHCCPHGSTCDVKRGTCSSNTNSFTITWDKIKPVTKNMKVALPESLGELSEQLGHDVMCPDKKSQCHHDNTCCKLSTGDYGCCPLPAAVCCSDGLHCCPHGSTCDVKSGTCSSNTNSFTITWDKIKPVTKNMKVALPEPLSELSEQLGHDVMCPDKKSQCHHDNTCCKLSTGDYGCCPLPAAVCCSDGLHCCPHGSTCDVKSGTCSSNTNSFTITWDKIKPLTMNMKVALPEPLSELSEQLGHDVMCPDKKSQCHHDNTCCKLSTGDYGCCPLPAAVCCSDGLHCCPHGSTCDVKSGTCSSNTNSFTITWDKIKPVTKNMKVALPEPLSELSEQLGHDVMCPDKKSQCHHDNTCCKLSTGDYGCCPLPAAICCSDGLHCCPHGSTCDVKSGTCSSTANSLTITWDHLRKSLPVLANKLENVEAIVCKDKSECPWGTTCCKSASGKYTCCTGKNATCCPDHVSCCPSGFTCGTRLGKTVCEKPGTGFVIDAALHARRHAKQVITIPWTEKIPAKQISADSGPVSDVIICPDKVHVCPNYFSCCQMDRSWGCCPLPKAVCCSDNKHCCPQGFTCNPQTMVCERRWWQP